MFDKRDFGNRIKSLRQLKDVSQEELGRFLGLSKQTISGIETGYRATTIEVSIALADFFNVSLDYLVGRSDDPTRR